MQIISIVSSFLPFGCSTFNITQYDYIHNTEVKDKAVDHHLYSLLLLCELVRMRLLTLFQRLLILSLLFGQQ